MGNAVSACMSKYSTFTGRASRSEYWYFTLFTFIAVIISSIIGGIMGSDLLGYAAQIALFIPGISVSVRRMHDVDKSGWFVLVPIYSFSLAVTPSTIGPNRFDEF